MVRSFSRLAKYGLATLLTSAAPAALAQSGDQPVASQPTESAAAVAAGGDEIIVTAMKRAENLQNVPIAVQAIEGNKLRSLNITSLGDLVRVSPSFNFFENSTPRNQATFIRGIGTFTTSDAIEPSVGVVVDQVALGRQGMAFVDPFDIERVEVLRGPQGSLFGKNASAGVVSITTRAPSEQFEAAGRMLIGSRNEYQAGVSVAGPLADGVTTRLTAYYNTRDGDVTNIYLHRNVNDLNNYGLRAKVRFGKGDNNLTVIGDFSRSYADCCAWVAVGDGGPGTYRTLLTTFGIRASEENREVAANVLQRSTSTNAGLSAIGNFVLGAENLTSVTSLRLWRTYEVTDADQLPLSLLNTFNRTRHTQFSQELRTSDDGTSRLAHTFGLYYFHYRIENGQFFEFPAAGFFPAAFGTVTTQRDSVLTYDNGAAFGDLTYRFADELTRLRLGGRLTIESVNVNTRRTSNTAAVFPSYQLDDRTTKTGFSGVISLQHNFAEDIMAYASVSRGFKGAAYDLPAAADPQPIDLSSRSVAPEKSTNYEIGLRTQFFDRQLTLNLTGFYTTFSNYQATTYDAALAIFRLQNVGSLFTRGVELEFGWHPTDAFRLNGGVTFADARYDSFKTGQCQFTFFNAGLCTEVSPGNLIIDLSGKQLFGAPKWSFVVDARYDIKTAPGPFNYFVLANYAYRSNALGDPSVDPVNALKARGLLDARIGIVTRDGRFELSAFGKNITNETYFQARFFMPLFGGLAAGNDANAAFHGLQRRYGVEFVGRF